MPTDDHLDPTDYLVIDRLRTAADTNGTVRVQDRHHGDHRLPVDDAIALFTEAMRPVPGFLSSGSWRFSTRSDSTNWLSVETQTANWFIQLAD